MRKKMDRQKKYYFSCSLRKKLKKIPNFPLTIVEAPSGFGKTTAIKEYLNEILCDSTYQYWYTCLGEPPSIAWKGVCQLLSKVNGKVADKLNNLEIPSSDTLFYMASYLRDFNCQHETYLVIDNYQLMECDVHNELINVFSMHGCPNLHMIFITQYIKTYQQISAHNNNIYTIDASSFFLDREGISSLLRMEGIRLSEGELESLYMSTEGWISAIRLQMINFQETGQFDLNADIEQLVESSIWNRLELHEKDFLMSVSIMDSFTASQAAIIIGEENLSEGIEKLLKTNDFIRYLPDKRIYNIHSIFQDYLLNRFYNHQSEEYQKAIYKKAGKACSFNLQYYQAANFYYKIRDFDSILSLPFNIEYLDNQKEKYQADFISLIVEQCPDDILCRYPLTILVFGYWTFMSGQIEAYKKLSNILKTLIQNKSASNNKIQKTIEGEFLFINSLEKFNDISEMLKTLKMAQEVLEESSQVIKINTPWMFATVSLLSVFWREISQLDMTLSMVDESKYIFRKLAKDYGAGAGSVFMAEAMLMRGLDENAEILCHRALYNARLHQQTDICICAELVLARIFILRGNSEEYFSTIKRIHSYSKCNSNLYIIRMIEHSITVLSLILGEKENIASWFYDIVKINKVVYSQVAPLAQILHLKILINEQRHKEFFGALQFILDNEKISNNNTKFLMSKIHQLIYVSIVNFKEGNAEEAQSCLNEALLIALPDKIYLPFAQEFNILNTMLESAKGYIKDRDGLNALIELGIRQDKGVKAIKKSIVYDRSPLTPREREIAILARERMSAKEIAEALYISETTVRTVLKSIYRKLDIHSKYELNFKEF